MNCFFVFVFYYANFLSRPKRVLIFNTTGDRNANLLLAPLKRCHFDVALFCSNIIDVSNESTSKG
jgi:hypothetical protein